MSQTGAPEHAPGPNGEVVIPEQAAAEMRKLVHDLSNALEVIVQTSFLLGMAELKEPASEWLKMLEGGVSKALDINGKLRSYLRQHSAKQP